MTESRELTTVGLQGLTELGVVLHGINIPRSVLMKNGHGFQSLSLPFYHYF